MAKLQPRMMKTEAIPTKNQPTNSGGRSPLALPGKSPRMMAIPMARWTSGRQATSAASPATA
jgi:hypothetical protein